MTFLPLRARRGGREGLLQRFLICPHNQLPGHYNNSFSSSPLLRGLKGRQVVEGDEIPPFFWQDSLSSSTNPVWMMIRNFPLGKCPRLPASCTYFQCIFSSGKGDGKEGTPFLPPPSLRARGSGPTVSFCFRLLLLFLLLLSKNGTHVEQERERKRNSFSSRALRREEKEEEGTLCVSLSSLQKKKKAACNHGRKTLLFLLFFFFLLRSRRDDDQSCPDCEEEEAEAPTTYTCSVGGDVFSFFVSPFLPTLPPP